VGLDHLPPDERRAKQREYQRRFRERRPERLKQIKAKYREAHREDLRAKGRTYYAATADRSAERRKHRAKDPAKRAADNTTLKAWRERNSEKVIEYSRRFEQKNREARRAKCRAYAKKNLPYFAAWSRRRKAAMLRAIPPWADLNAIRAIYEECAKVSARTGMPHHVDHIIPLNSKVVCGLHVECNLQIIPAVENIRKSNRLIEGRLDLAIGGLPRTDILGMPDEAGRHQAP
jgi:hypothetical protein